MNLSIQVEPLLKTSSGMMHGSYQMQDYKEERLRFLFHHSLWIFQIMKKKIKLNLWIT